MNYYQLKKVSKVFGTTKALDNISLSFTQEVTFVLGDSGSGKSTMLNILGLLDDVSEGELIYNGFNLSGSSEKSKDNFRATKIGFVFQDSNLLSELTVQENLDLAVDISNFEKKEYQYLLNRFGIEKLKNQKVKTLSGGERQRVSIVRALLKDSDIILADEPTGNLDEMNSGIVFDALKECVHTYKKTVIIVSHNEKAARKYADRIISIRDGKIESDTKDQSEKSELGYSQLTTYIEKEDVKDSNIKFKKLFKLSYNNFLRKIAKIIPIGLTIGLAIAALGIVLDLNNNTENMLKDINTNYLETDFLEIRQIPHKPFRPLSLGTPFINEQIQEITSTDYFSEVVPIFDISLRLSFNNRISEFPLIRYIKINDFFQKRIMSNNIEGSFLKDTDQIILGEDIVKYLFGNEAWRGKEVEAVTGDGTTISLKVVGVNHTKNSDGMYISYCSNEVSFFFSKNMTDKYGELDLEDEVMNHQGNVSTGGFAISWSKEKPEKLLFGKLPQNNNEIVIDLLMFNELMNDKYQNKQKFKAIDFTKMENEKTIDAVINRKFLLYVQNLFFVKITGVVDSNAKTMVFCSQELATDIEKPAFTNLNCYAKNLDIVKNFDQNPLAAKYNCLLKYRHFIASISSKTDNFRLMLIIIASIILLISVFMINSFVKLSIIERTYEIGVLRSLGGQKSDIIRMFRLEHAFVGAMAGIISILMYIMGKILVASLLSEGVVSFYLNGKLIIMLFLACVIFVPISGFLPMIKINKMKPIDCIRNK